MAVSRQVFNPIEAKDVVGITNYIDLGKLGLIAGFLPLSVQDKSKMHSACSRLSEPGSSSSLPLSIMPFSRDGNHSSHRPRGDLTC